MMGFVEMDCGERGVDVCIVILLLYIFKRILSRGRALASSRARTHFLEFNGVIFFV
jgi:hypothetical protein